MKQLMLYDEKYLNKRFKTEFNGVSQEKIKDKKNSTWAQNSSNYYSIVYNAKTKLPSSIYKPFVIDGKFVLHPQSTKNIKNQDLIEFDSIAQSVIDDIQTFFDAKEKFKQARQKYRRGILLYGPPGSGKSCIIKQIIRLAFDLDGLVVDGSTASPNLTNNVLNQIKTVEPDRLVIVLLEDIDSMLERHDQSEVLNMIDGVSSPEGFVFIATTNYIDKLEQRIQNRPSRFDRRYYISYPSDPARRRLIIEMAKQFNCSPDVDRWVSDTKHMTVSHINELFISVYLLNNNYKDSLDAVKGMIKPVKNGNGMSNEVGFFKNIN